MRLNKKYDISVVIATYNRAKFLNKSFDAYNCSNYNMDDVEFIIVDDDSTDNTEQICREWFNKGLNIKYIKNFKKENQWIDAAHILNLGIRACNSRVIMGTHPEVLIGKNVFKYIMENINDNIYLGIKPFYTNEEQAYKILEMESMDGILTQYTKFDGVWNLPPPPFPDYRAEAIMNTEIWCSWVMGVMTRDTWRNIGGVTEFEQWGSGDPDFLTRRRILGIKDTPIKNDFENMCIHVYHAFAGTDDAINKSYEKCEEGLKTVSYRSRMDAIRDNL